MRNKYQQKGFTLIELLVVIVILGILSTISVGTFRSYFAKARDSERVSTVQNIAMMIKVDSGGSGDCKVYNYGNGLKHTSGDTITCNGVDTSTLKTLLENNDYSMPSAKNGLTYYYGFKIGATEGDNEFFVAVGAEEEHPQNGKEETGGGEFIFVDGTTEGIAAALAGDATIDCDVAAGGVITCNATNWELFTIDDDAELL